MDRFFRAFFLMVIISLLVLPLGWLSTAAQSDARVELVIDTAVPQDGLLTLHGAIRLGGDLGLPVGAGDITGDGRADVIFCQMYANAGGGFRDNNGQVNFYVSDGRDTGFVNAAQNPPNIFKLIGADSGDLLGSSVATGDVNGDGFREVALGTFGDDGPNNSRFNSGAVYVVWGAANFSLNADLRTLDGQPPPGITAIYGARANSRTGIWVDMGDIDRDGYADIVMGADQINGSGGRNHIGGACVIFGGPALPPVIDLAAVPAGIRMMVILGADTEDHWGSALHVGDINNDGFGDVAIAGSIFRDSASYVTPDDEDSGHDARAANYGGRRPGCGEVYVVYGSANMPAVIDLSNPPPGSTHVIGAMEKDLLGSQIHSADLNGDGQRDLIIGALQAMAPDNKGRTGAVYIIYGSPQIVGATVDLAMPNTTGLHITTIYGEDALDCAGDSVRSYDINGDGLSDLFVGSPEHSFQVNNEFRFDAGDTKFIFGRRDFLPELIKLYDPPAGLRIYRLAGAQGAAQGVEGGDEMSYRLTGGDVDGDGYIDYIANAMHADGFMDAFPNAGDVHIFSGKKLSQRLGMLGPDPGPVVTPTLTSATLSSGGQTVEQANAGQAGLRITINGTNFRFDTEITVNGRVVVARVPSGPGLGATRRIVELDENPAVRNVAGPLVVRARNTQPPSNLSNEITAGRLVGPEITRVKPKRKGSGVLLLKISGSNFAQGMTVRVFDGSGQQVTVKSVSFDSSEALTAKIAASAAPPPGASLRVTVAAGTSVTSNEVTVALP